MCTVAGIDIKMFAPQTLWAVVGESISFHLHTTVFAYKILNLFCKREGHQHKENDSFPFSKKPSATRLSSALETTEREPLYSPRSFFKSEDVTLFLSASLIIAPRICRREPVKGSCFI